MLFPTVEFALFFAVVLPLNWLLMSKPAAWRIFMIVASFAFYSVWNWKFIFLLGGSIGVNHLIASQIHASEGSARKQWMWFGITLNLIPLIFFKYWNFLLDSGSGLADVVGLQLTPSFISIALPVGLSFYTFMAISYLVDIYRYEFEPVSIDRFAVYLAFFPHLVAGPIVRPHELIPQIETANRRRDIDTGRAFSFILGGLILKVLFATNLARAVDPVFDNPQAHGAVDTVVAIYAYSVQIFADFAGYTAMAIGIALLLGFKLPDNFNSPYRALSLQDFWHRWHISLSNWLRDYVYVPFGGNRRGKLLTYRNLMLTMLIGGLWHGAGWTFVIWGGLHGFGLAAERLLRERRRSLGQTSTLPPYVGWILTFHFVAFAWVFFRATSLGNATDVLSRLVSGWQVPAETATPAIVGLALVGIALHFLPMQKLAAVGSRFRELPFPAQGVFAGAALMLISAVSPSGVAPFIYFNF